MALTTINSYWDGDTLGEIEQICLLSWLRQGHQVRLFSYGQRLALPHGVELEDAAAIMPRARMISHTASGSPAIGTNRLRYRMMRQNLGTWLDTDMLLLRPVEDAAMIFGRESGDLLNNAVLRLPPAAAITTALCDFVEQDFPIPPFYDPALQLELRMAAKSGAPFAAQELPWGVFGPQALTYFVNHHGLADHAHSQDAFYAVPWHQAHSLFSAANRHILPITPATIGLHLWNAALRRPSRLRPRNPKGVLIVEQGCFMEEFARQELGFHMTNLTLPAH